MSENQKTVAAAFVPIIFAVCVGVFADNAIAQQSESEQVIRIRSRPLDQWLQDLQSDNATKRYVAAERALPTAREHAAIIVPRLMEILQHPREEVRYTAARTLAGFQETAREAIPALERSINDPSPIVQLYAANALYQIDQRSELAVRLILEGLDADDEHVRRFSHTMIREMGGDARAAVPTLLQQLQRGDLDTQRVVLRSIAAIGPRAQDAIPQLIELLSDRQLDGPAFHALESIGRAALPALVESIDDPASLHRRNVCRLLVRIAPQVPEVATAIVLLLDDPEPQIRGAAARGIGRMHVQSEVILTALERATRDPVEPVAVAAVAALKTQGPSAVPILRNLIRDGKPPLRRQAMASLSELGSVAAPAIPELIVCLEEGDEAEKIAVLQCLRRVGNSPGEVITSVHRLVKEQIDSPPNDPLLREAVWTLVAYDAVVVVPHLVALLEAQRKGERNYVGADSPAALGLIAPIMRSDGEHAYVDSRDMELAWLIGALSTFGERSQEALPALKRIRDDPEMLPWNRHAATKAIAAIE